MSSVVTWPTWADEADDDQQDPSAPIELTLESLYHPDKKKRFEGKLPQVHWIGDQPSRLFVKRGDQWREFDLQTGQERDWPLVDQLADRLAGLDGISEDAAKTAAMSAVTKLSELDDTVLVRIGQSLALVGAETPARWMTRDASQWRNVQLDPTARRLAYTRDGDMFVIDLESDRTIRLTDDGSATMLDGVLDWTYQEEIFGRGNYRGHWFSQNGRWLAMLQIDTSLVPEYMLSKAASDRGRGITRRYPKVGDPIPHASLLVWDLRDLSAGQVPPHRTIETSTPEQERIITGVWWSPQETSLLYTVSDRQQSWRELKSVDPQQLATDPTAAPRLLLREVSPTWIEPPTAPTWLADGNLIWMSELPSGSYRLYHIGDAGRVTTPVSPEGLRIADFAVDPDGTYAVVSGNADRNAVGRHAYLVELTPGSSNPVTPLTERDGWHQVRVSPDRRWLVDRFSTPTTPTELSVREVSGPVSHVIAESELRLAGDLHAPRVTTIPSHDGYPLPAMLVRPKEASQSQPCPVVVEVYGGPHAPVVSSRWGGRRALYRELLARQGIATLVVDNRSSAGRTLADSWPIHRRVGEVELADLKAAIEWLKQQPWVDENRLALRGWSFGGFMTLYAMTHSDDFAAGIAGGSVTDWAEYDAFYTERYMGLADENSEGYRDTAPVNVAGELSGRVLLIHGEDDDNVHPSNTMRMAAALQEAGKDFELMIYPGSAHAVHHPRQSWHLQRMTHRFLQDALQ